MNNNISNGVNVTPQQNVAQQKPAQNAGGYNLQFFLSTFLLNWKWFVLSLILFLAGAVAYLRYATPLYDVSAKILVKDEDKRNSNIDKITAAANLGFTNNSDGFDNEMEIIKSVAIAEGAIRDLKLYVSYSTEGTVRRTDLYGRSPILADLDSASLADLNGSLSLNIKKNGKGYSVHGHHITKAGKPEFSKQGTLPMTIATPAGKVILTAAYVNNLDNADELDIVISNPRDMATSYAKGTSVAPLSKTTTIANLNLKDPVPQRAIDYLKQLVVVYNRKANEDKNQIARRTETFINQRITMINGELGATDGKIESFKRSNSMIDPVSAASQAMTNTDASDKQLVEINTQLMLLKSLKDYMHSSHKKYETLPSNVGLTDASAVALISQYNQIALQRNSLLRSASELSPKVQAYTSQLEELSNSIAGAVEQASKSLLIQRSSILQQHGKYSGVISEAPQYERVLTEIGRQQSVISSLYIMLLQKREENNIELAATADVGRLIDEPVCTGKVSPKSSMILLLAIILGMGFPFLIFIIIDLLRFRIEGHADVKKLTDLPIIADIAVANEAVKKGDIVVYENRNSQMEEIFRGLRTNLQFMLKENENVIMFTSSTSGEGKTFVASNIAVSCALLGKKVVLVGLDIRRPRLANLFSITGHKEKGITPLLMKDAPTLQDIKEQIVPSGINANLDLLLAGPVPPNPSELIARPSLEVIFQHLRQEYDYVIIDTAPVGLVTDTLQLRDIANVTVMVCRADYTERSAISLFNDLAATEKLRNMCVVINGIDMSKKKHSYEYGYGAYGHYHRYGMSYGHEKYGYHSYGYGSYSNSHYGSKDDNSIKK